MLFPLLTFVVLHLKGFQPTALYVLSNVENVDILFLNLLEFYYLFLNKPPSPNYPEPTIEKKYVVLLELVIIDEQ